jgi:predicted MPP superfamily phosphohydrolase
MDTNVSEIHHSDMQSISRRRFMKQAGMWLAAAAGLVAGTGAYSCLIERKWIEIRSCAISLPALPRQFRGVKLVQFSDVHLGHYFHSTDLQRVTEMIAQLEPEVICFTGDLVDHGVEDLPDAVHVLRRLEAPLGKFAVLGNHDYRVGAEEVRQALESAGFHVLTNAHAWLERDGARIYLAGVDDALYGTMDLDAALHGIPQQGCTLLLAHEPDVAIRAAAYPVALQLSGHSHGGQVRLPWFGHLLTPPLARRYVEGLNAVEGSQLQVFVNRGLGTTILPVRFYCRPELTVLTLG